MSSGNNCNHLSVGITAILQSSLHTSEFTELPTLDKFIAKSDTINMSKN